MKPRKSQILAYSIACVLAIGAGLAYGLNKPTPAVKISCEELIALMQDENLAFSRIDKIEFVSAAWPDRNYPQLRLQLKNPNSKAVIIQPRLKQVEWVLESSAKIGINFDQIQLIPTAMYNYRDTKALVRNGFPTNDYHCPPSFVGQRGLPSDYLDYYRDKNPDVVKSLGLDSPKYSETSSDGTQNAANEEPYVRPEAGPW